MQKRGRGWWGGGGGRSTLTVSGKNGVTPNSQMMRGWGGEMRLTETMDGRPCPERRKKIQKQVAFTRGKTLTEEITGTFQDVVTRRGKGEGKKKRSKGGRHQSSASWPEYTLLHICTCVLGFACPRGLLGSRTLTKKTSSDISRNEWESSKDRPTFGQHFQSEFTVTKLGCKIGGPKANHNEGLNVSRDRGGK